jgi:hypothetical protein
MRKFALEYTSASSESRRLLKLKNVRAGKNELWFHEKHAQIKFNKSFLNMQELSQRDLENVVTALGQRRFIIFLE